VLGSVATELDALDEASDDELLLSIDDCDEDSVELDDELLAVSPTVISIV